MKNLSKASSINYFVLMGTVVSGKELSLYKKTSPTCQIILRIETSTRMYYTQIVAFNAVAKALNLVSEVGNVILVEGHIVSEIKIKSLNKKAILKLVATNVELINKTIISEKEIEEKLEVITEFDPITYLGEKLNEN